MSRTPKGYHQATSYDRYAMELHAMDWAHQPNPYKSYPADLDGVGVELAGIKGLYDQSLCSVYDAGSVKKTTVPPDLETVSEICMLAAGLTARSRQGSGYFYYRGAPSAGALYPNEIYFAAFGSQMIPAGIYHLGVHSRFLTRLRAGNFAGQVTAAIPDLSPDVSGVFIVSGIFFRSAWKYRKRAYRYVLLDAGHLAENLRLAISAAGYAGCLHAAFEDRKLDTLLGVDEQREGSLCCISISGGNPEHAAPEAEISELPPAFREAGRVSSSEINYPEIRDIHDAGKTVVASPLLFDPMMTGLGINPPDGYLPVPKTPVIPAALNYSETVLKRRSKRNFTCQPIDTGQLNYILRLLCRASGPLTEENPGISSSAAIGFLAGNVEGVAPGFYLLDPAAGKTGRVFSGNVMETMASVCLDQAWLRNAAVHFVFMTNLEILSKTWGARGYRYAMLTAGRLGHAVYLGATAMGLGCCGIGALYDNEARQVLGLNADSALLYLVAVGKVK